MLDHELEKWTLMEADNLANHMMNATLSQEEQKQVLRALARHLNEWADNIEDGG